MVSDSRVCSQQQNALSNQNILIYGKLWKKVENESRYQKGRQSRKGNGVCREDEESIEEGWGSIKKDSEIDEVTSKQGEK